MVQKNSRCSSRLTAHGEDTIDLPALARTALRPLVAQLIELRLQIRTIEKELLAWHRTSQESRRLETIPGVGFITATAIAATVTIGKNAPSPSGLGDADMGRSRRRGVSPTCQHNCYVLSSAI